MQLRSLALLVALLPGLVAPAGMSWCSALCTALRPGGETQPAATHSCCESPGQAPVAPRGTQVRSECGGCKLPASPRSDLLKHEVAAAAVSLAPPSAAPFITPTPDAPRARIRAAFTPPATAGPGLAPLPLRI